MDSTIVSILFAVAAIILFIISFCIICKWCGKGDGGCTKEKKEKCKNKEELDRFLGAEESEDKVVKLKDEGTFHHITLIEETDSDVVSHKSGDDGQSVHLEFERRTITPVEEEEIESVVVELAESAATEVLPPAPTANGTPPKLTSQITLDVEWSPQVPEIELAPIESAPTEIAPTEIAPTEIAPTEIAPGTDSVISTGSTKKPTSSKSKRKFSLRRQSSTTTNEFPLETSFTLKISLQYIENVKCLQGEISSISGLNFQADSTPDEFSFHLRFVPSKKFHMMTKYKPVGDCSNINMSFTMGPVRKDELVDNQLRIKLYGRKSQRLTRSSCFGECSYNLIEIIDKPIPTEFEEDVIESISRSPYSSDSDSLTSIY